MENTEVQEWLDQGKVLYSLERYESALAYFDKALEQDPYCEEIYENMSMCYIMLDQFSKAKTLLKKYLMLNKKSGAAYFHLGNIALLEDVPDEAKAFYSKAELLGFQNPTMYINLASFYEEQNDLTKAISQYNKVLRLNPYDYEAMDRKAELQFRSRQFAESLQTARTMVQTDVDRFEGHHLVYSSLILLDRYEEAERYIKELIQRLPHIKDAQFDLARLYDLTGRTDEALEMLEKAVENIGQDLRAARLKLGLLLQKNKVDEAVEFIKNSPALEHDGNAMTMMYSVCFSKREYGQAIEYCNKIQKLGKDSPYFYATWYFKPLAQKYLGKIEQAERDFRDAADQIRTILRENPQHVELNMYRALCEYQLKNYKEALRLAEFMLAIDPDSAVFHLVAASIYEALNRLDEAREHRNDAERLDPNAVAPLM